MRIITPESRKRIFKLCGYDVAVVVAVTKAAPFDVDDDATVAIDAAAVAAANGDEQLAVSMNAVENVAAAADMEDAADDGDEDAEFAAECCR